jgi:WD40 repeat protein
MDKQLGGQSEVLHHVVFSPDGRQVITGGADGVVRVWDVQGGKELKSLMGHTAAVYSVDISPDGRLLVSGSADRTVLVWDTATWQHFAELRGSADEVGAAAFSPDGQRVGVASADGIVRVYGREMFAPLDEVLALVPSRITRVPAALTDDERARFVHQSQR